MSNETAVRGSSGEERTRSVWWAEAPMLLFVLGALVALYFDEKGFLVWALALVGAYALFIPPRVMAGPLGHRPLRLVWVLVVGWIMYNHNEGSLPEAGEFVLVSLALLGALALVAIVWEMVDAHQRDTTNDMPVDERIVRLAVLAALALVYLIIGALSGGHPLLLCVLACLTLAGLYAVCLRLEGLTVFVSVRVARLSWAKVFVVVALIGAVLAICGDETWPLAAALWAVALLGLVAARQVPGQALRGWFLIACCGMTAVWYALIAARWIGASDLGAPLGLFMSVRLIRGLLTILGTVILLAMTHELHAAPELRRDVKAPSADNWLRIGALVAAFVFYSMWDDGSFAFLNSLPEEMVFFGLLIALSAVLCISPWQFVGATQARMATMATGASERTAALRTAQSDDSPGGAQVAPPGEAAEAVPGIQGADAGQQAQPPQPPPPPKPRVSDVVARIYASKLCGICRNPFEPGSAFVECPDCRAWYHDNCWQRSGGCVTDGCPSVPSKVARRARVAQTGVPAQPVAVARAIRNVGFCPYCQTAVQAGSDYVTCPACKTPYHPDCWQENGGCAVYGCNVRISG